MNDVSFHEDRLAAIRAGLVEQVRLTPRRRLPFWGAVGVFALAGVLAGGTVSAAALGLQPKNDASPFTIGSTAGTEGAVALPGTIPGTPIVTPLGAARSGDAIDGETVRLADPPAGATSLRVSVTCLTAGEISWGLDQGGANPSVSCSQRDVGTASAAGYLDTPINSSTRSLDVSSKGSWVLSYQYLRVIATAWGVNAQRKTYGVEKAGVGSPDLLAVDGVGPNGAIVHGYAYASQLQKVGPTPRSPEEASSQAPASTQIPIYKSDGQTQIGTFAVG